MASYGGGGTLRLAIAYRPHLTPDEHRPKIKAWISFDHNNTTTTERWTVTKKLRANSSVSAVSQQVFDVPLPSEADLPSIPLEAAVHFQVYAKMTDIHGGGEENYEKDGSGMLYLAQIFAGKKGRALTKPVVVPMTVQACIIEKTEPVSKGQLLVTLSPRGTDVRRRLVFAPPSRWDVVPGNVKNLQADIFTLIQRNLIIFDDKITAEAGVDFKLSLTEGKRVHAPLFVNSTGLILPGEIYFDNISQHSTEWDEGFFGQILDISISRAGWNRQRYVEAIGAGGASSNWAEYLAAVRITGQSLTIVSNSLPYIADLAEDDSRKKEVVESFDDPLSKNDGDCEDVAWLEGEQFRALRDGTNFRQAHVLAAQRVLRLYKACGALGTVTSRNIDESSGQGKPEIGTPRDLKVVTGAHMTLILLPREFYWRMLANTSSRIGEVERRSEPSFVPRHPTTGAIVRQPWERNLPVMITEGTGGLVCTPLAVEAYFETRPEKERAILENLKQREAFARLLTGLGPKQRSQIDQSSLRILPGFDGMQILRMKDTLVNDPNVRVNSFFRMQTELFPIPERHEEIGLGAGTSDPSSTEPSDPYSVRKIIPVQMGPRSGGGGGGSMTAGVNMADILNKRTFVGGLRLTKAHGEEVEAIRAGVRHLPPIEELCRPSAKDAQKKGKQFLALNRGFGGAVTKGSLAESKTTPAFVYWRLKKFGGEEQARQLGESMRRNPLVTSAALHLDHVAEGVATVRLQARVLTSDMVGLNPELMDNLLGSRVSPHVGASFSERTEKHSRATRRARVGSRIRKDRIALSMKEISELERETDVHGKDCLRKFLISMDQSNGRRTAAAAPFGSTTGRNGGDPSAIENAMLERIIRSGSDVREINSATILRTESGTIDVTSAGDAIRLMDETSVDSPKFIDIVCAAYGQFRGLMDYLLSLFVTNGQSDAEENARVLRDRLRSCREAVATLGLFSLTILRAIIGAVMPIVEWIEGKMTDVLSFAGVILGTVADVMVRESEKVGDYLKPIARAATRIVVFSSASMAVFQNMFIDPTKKKIDAILSRIIGSLGGLLRNLQTAILRHTEEASSFLSKVWARIAETAVWARFTSISEQAYGLLGEVQDAVKTILGWLISAISALGGGVILVLMAVTAPASLLLNALMDKIMGKNLTLLSGFPMEEDQREKLVDRLLASKQVDAKTKKGLWEARERFRLDELEYMAKMGADITPRLSDGTLRQIKLAWSLSGEVADWIVDGVELKPTPDTLRMARQYLGIDLIHLSKIDTTAYRSYVWWMIKAMTKEAPQEMRDEFFRVLSEDPQLKQKISGDIATDTSGKLSPEEEALLKTYCWLERSPPTAIPESYRQAEYAKAEGNGGEEEEEEEEEEFMLGEAGVTPEEARRLEAERKRKRIDLAQEMLKNPAKYSLAVVNFDLLEDLEPEMQRRVAELIAVIQREPYRIMSAPDPGEFEFAKERIRLALSFVIGLAVFGVFFVMAKWWIQQQADRRDEEERVNMKKYWDEEASSADRQIMKSTFTYFQKGFLDPEFLRQRRKEEVEMMLAIREKEESTWWGQIMLSADRILRGAPKKIAIAPPEPEQTIFPALPAPSDFVRGLEAAQVAVVPTQSQAISIVAPSAGEYESDFSFAALREDERFAGEIMQALLRGDRKLDLRRLKPTELRAVITPVWLTVEDLFRQRYMRVEDLVVSMQGDEIVGDLLKGKLSKGDDPALKILAAFFRQPKWAEASDTTHALAILARMKSEAMMNFEQHVERDRMRWYLTVLQFAWKTMGFMTIGLPDYMFSWARMKETNWNNAISMTWNYTPAVYFGVLGYALAHNITSALFRLTYWRSSKEVWLRFAKNLGWFGIGYLGGPFLLNIQFALYLPTIIRYVTGQLFLIIKRAAAGILGSALSPDGVIRNVSRMAAPWSEVLFVVAERVAPEFAGRAQKPHED